jgi:hypothetical protein
MASLLNWNVIQQVIRYFMAWGGTWYASTGAPEDLWQPLTGGAVALAGFVWWWFTARKAQISAITDPEPEAPAAE